MEGLTHLALAYLGMLGAIALWTWTVVRRSQRLEQRLAALERAGSEETVETPATVDAPAASHETEPSVGEEKVPLVKTDA